MYFTTIKRLWGLDLKSARSKVSLGEVGEGFIDRGQRTATCSLSGQKRGRRMMDVERAGLRRRGRGKGKIHTHSCSRENKAA